MTLNPQTGLLNSTRCYESGANCPWFYDKTLSVHDKNAFLRRWTSGIWLWNLLDRRWDVYLFDSRANTCVLVQPNDVIYRKNKPGEWPDFIAYRWDGQRAVRVPLPPPDLPLAAAAAAGAALTPHSPPGSPPLLDAVARAAANIVVV